MTIQNALKQKHMSIYRLTNASEMPYATVNDICNDKVRLEKEQRRNNLPAHAFLLSSRRRNLLSSRSLFRETA